MMLNFCPTVYVTFVECLRICVNRFKLIMSTFLMKTGLTDNHLMENLIRFLEVGSAMA